MAQRPVANALITELEPAVLQELRRHLDSEDLWYAHDYVPFEQGQNFAFLGGKDFDPSEVTLPRHITDALEILLITKDNLAGYHRELVVEVLNNTEPTAASTGLSKAKYTLAEGTAERVHAASTELLAANPLYPGLTL